MAKARNENSNCAMCCNPNPTQVYKHLPGFVKLLCSLSESLASSAGLKALIGDETGSGALVFATSPTLVTPVLGTASATGITITKVNGQQTTSLTTAIVANGYAGVLQTIAPSIASGASVLIPVTNNKVLTSSTIKLTLEYPDSGTGIPHVVISSVANGSFVIKVTNLHASNTINTVMKFHYSIV